MSNRGSRSAVLVVLALLHQVVPAAAQSQQNDGVAMSTGIATLIESSAAPRTPFDRIRFSLPAASDSTAGTIASIHNGRPAIALQRREPRSLPWSMIPAQPAAPTRKRPGLWAAVGAGAGAGLGVLYARAGHPGLPHAPGGDTADEVLYVPLFGGIGAIVGWILGSR
jgi:hypothetical protein